MERCKYELFVENYFGFNTDEVITEKTKITTDFGQLVNLLAMFDNERASADSSHESSGLNKPVVNHPVCHLCRDTGWYFIPNFAGGGQTVRCGCGK